MGCRTALSQGQEEAGSQTSFLCWIISFQQFYCNYPAKASIYRASPRAAVPWGEVGGGDRKGKGIRQEEG